MRARWKKGQEKPEGNCFPSLVSQFMLGKWFSEVALQQNYDRGAWRHRVVSATSLFFARVMLCVMFSVSSWELFCDRVSPLERQGTQVAAPAFPPSCLSVSETEGSVRSASRAAFSLCTEG